ncbi:MAG: hypothetical protein ABI664_15315 [bacterium]
MPTLIVTNVPVASDEQQFVRTSASIRSAITPALSASGPGSRTVNCLLRDDGADDDGDLQQHHRHEPAGVRTYGEERGGSDERRDRAHHAREQQRRESLALVRYDPSELRA